MIEVEHLSKNYGTTVAIEDITFKVEPGEITGFLGPNGAGKTTTMRILAGYIPAEEGTAKIAGYDVRTQVMEVRKSIGYLPETPPLYQDMTVEGFLDFVACIKGVPGKLRKGKVHNAMERCQLEDKRQVLITKLSKGYKQRVGIAQAIVHEPPVIILDEPTVGLDPRQIIEVRNLIKSLKTNHTVILSTHILPEVNMTCDRVTIINKGKVVVTDTTENLLKKMQGISGYVVEVQGDLSSITPLLKTIPGVVDIQLNPQQSRCLLEITTTGDTEPGRDIAAVIVHAGINLYEMRRLGPTLEEVFLELTTQDVPEKDG